MGPTGNTRIVQIHPTRKCNLSCKHCYSSSSPQATDTLDPAVLKRAIDDLAAEGYEWLTFSGGEPLVYDPLAELLQHARQADMNTTLVSNGMLLTGGRLDAIENHVNALVVSLDGKPESHNRMRNSSRAFDSMANNLPELRKRGIDFGILFTLTQHNLDELPWVVDFSVNMGACGLVIHPLEIAGNATEQLHGKSPDSIENGYAWMLTEKLKKKYAGQINIHTDLVHTMALAHNPEQFFLGPCPDPLPGRMSDMLASLIIEPDGEVVPLQYGFPREYSLGNLKHTRIRDMVERWRTSVGPAVYKLCSEMHSVLQAECDGQFINWYERLDKHARQTHRVAFQRQKTTIDVSECSTV